jgi:prepilin-type processing-associated H-X9-DG protein
LGCPSDRRAVAPLSLGGTCPSNYVACHGDSIVGHDWGEINLGRGTFMRHNRSSENLTGSMGIGTRTLGGIADGLSNTMAISETAIGAGGDNYRGNLTRSSNVPDLRGAGVGPDVCAATRGQGGNFATGFSGNDRKGRWWGRYDFQDSLFNATLPPNSPSCDRGGWVNPPSSFHAGGVNVVMCDGAVRFLSDSISTGNTSRALGYPARNSDGHHWNGPSTYGVFGAMATPNGGESISSL